MSKTTDLVAAVTVEELRDALAVVSRISRYLSRSISSQFPNITTLLFALHGILKEKDAVGLEEPVLIVYHPETKLFLVGDNVDEACINAVTVLPTGKLVFHQVELSE